MASGVPTPAQMELRRAQMFPSLDDVQVARVRRFGQERTVADGTLIVEEGDRDVPFHVVLEGALEVVHPHCGEEEAITVHHAGEFTGEVDLLADRRSLVRVRARGATRVIQLEPPRLRALVQTDAEIGEILMRAFILRRVGLLAGDHGDAIVLGSRRDAATLRLQEFLTRNSHPYQYVDVDADPNVQSLLDTFHVGVRDIPVLICRGERVLKNPSDAEVADCLGFNAAVDVTRVRDLVIIGAGPAGLAAAVYAASEGLDVLTVEGSSPGGQAGSSSKIENYFGFPTGISGQALVSRALLQAEKFGAQFAVARGATKLRCDETPIAIDLTSGETLRARAVLIASGARYRKLELPNLARYEGVGVYYAASFVESQRCEGEEVVVIGGGNSAGQAATFLARSCRHVHVAVRGPGLAATMSSYLIRRIEDSANITLHTHTQVVELEGDAHLESVTWENAAKKERSTRPIRHVFSMTGAVPNTAWLEGCVALDEHGFVLTGPDVDAAKKGSPLSRPRLLLETSRPRVFAVGDVRSGSVKRVASSVGEGSVCIQMVHQVLSEARGS